jgi:hypothetical protein
MKSLLVRKLALFTPPRDGSHRGNFGESLETLPAVKSVVGFFLGYRFFNPMGLAYGFFGAQDTILLYKNDSEGRL